MSFISQSLGDSGVLVRITPPDIFGALAIGFYILSGHGFSFRRYWYMVTFIIALLVGAILGLNFGQSLIEILIHLFLFMIFMIIIFHFGSPEGLKHLIYFFAWAGILASVFGIYDYAAMMVGLPRIFPSRTSGEVLSGFRNAGQAGAYALIVLSVLIPVRSSRMFDLFKWEHKRIITYSIVATLIFLILTGKIAAYIGFAIAISGFFLMQRNLRAFVMILVSGAVVMFLFFNLDSIAPEIATRINMKYETRLAGTLSGQSSILDDDQFIGGNLRKAMQSFYDNPITGCGIGAFSGGIYDKYEIHSTYFKMLGEAGALGVFAYIIFILNFFNKLKYRSLKYPYREFLYYLVPFIIGCMASWAYTYHMRKREFWIMFAIIIITDQLIRMGIFGENKNNQTEASSEDPVRNE